VTVSFRLNLDDQVQHIAPAVPVCVTAQQSASDVIKRMKKELTGSVLVCEDESLVGIFTERDVLRMMAAGDSFERPVRDFMTPNPTTMAPSDTVGQAIRSMSEGGYRRLPVVDERGKPIAVLKVSDILNYLVEHFPHYIYNLPPAPHHTHSEREGA
jgi:CBS domain-containing protein